jgi:D-amino-acid oxidase
LPFLIGALSACPATFDMPHSVAIVGAGVSGLSCAVLFAERGLHAEIFADEIGQHTTSAAAGAVWFPYDAEPAGKVIPWALETYRVLADLAREDSRSGVSMIELRQFSRAAKIQIPDWAHSLGASVISTEVEKFFPVFRSGYAITVPLTDTTIYLDYLAQRFIKAGGRINANIRLKKLEEIDPKFDLVINCAGVGARTLVPDTDLEPHRGQVVIVPRIHNLACAVVCDDPPLTYAIPRTNDCVFGGTNEINESRDPDSAVTSRILSECSRALNISAPKILAERVGLRPFRKSGVRLEPGRLHDGRAVIHDYGHGGSGFTLSWGCAQQVLDLVGR